MANGKPGDHPVTDIVNYGHAVFSVKIDGMVRELDGLMTRKNLLELIDWLSPPPTDELEATLRTTLQTLKRVARERGWDVVE